jgi:hypothetical protein
MDPQLALFLDVTRPQLDLAALDEDELRVARALRWGRANARQVRDVAAEAGLPTRRAQDVIERLIHEHGWPVGTSMSEPYGNYLIDSADDLQATVELLRERGISNLARAAALKKTSIRRFLAEIQEDLLRERKSA